MGCWDADALGMEDLAANCPLDGIISSTSGKEPGNIEGKIYIKKEPSFQTYPIDINPQRLPI